MQKLLTFFQKNISVYAIFDDQRFNDTLAKDIVSFEQLGPELYILYLRQLHCMWTDRQKQTEAPDQAAPKEANPYNL